MRLLAEHLSRELGISKTHVWEILKELVYKRLKAMVRGQDPGGRGKRYWKAISILSQIF